MEKRVARIVATFAVAVALGWALFLLMDGRGAPGNASWAAELGRAELPDPERGALHLVFQEGDCVETLESLRTLGVLGRARGLGVGGIVLEGRTSVPGGVEALVGQPLPFPLRHDRRRRTTRMLRSLGFRRTPVILVTDAGGRLRAAFPGGPTGTSLTPAEVIDHADALLDRWP